MKKKINEIRLTLPAISVNEAVARSIISAFVAEANPTVEELGDLRCAVSEAVTNCIVHAYPAKQGYIYISARLYDTREITVKISDRGIGIENLEKAREPMFTTGKAGERCGMGFLVMESFTDELNVKSAVGKGTTVFMRKILKP